jgi:hypothetical protein
MFLRTWALPQALRAPDGTSGSPEGLEEQVPASPVVQEEEGAPPTSAPAEASAEAGSATGGEGGSASPKPPVVDWRERRIAQLTAKLREAEARASAVPPAAAAAPQADLSLVETRARELAAAQRFNDQCNDAATAGRQEFTDFDTRVNALVQLVDRSDANSVSAYNQFLSAALETGAAPRLIHELGGDLNEASRILALPPVKMAVELARRAMTEPTAVSRTPKPLATVGSRGVSNEVIDPRDSVRADKLSTAAWMERREAQVREQQAKRRG